MKKESKKQTAVEWLCDELGKFYAEDEFGIPMELYKKAKQMEREQIEEAYCDGANDEHNSIYSMKSYENYYEKEYGK